MKFPWRIIGHDTIRERLEADYAKGFVAQSYLFCGPAEIGKFRLAKTFAQLLQCENKNLCRHCDTCRQIEKNIHQSTRIVDRLWMKDAAEDLEFLAKYSNFDQGHRKKAGKKSDQIGVEDVQVFTEFLTQKTDAPYKICIVRNLERMTTGAMNTFLKVLEEPPPKTIFLLTTTHWQNLLPTVVSRTRILEMHLVQNAVLRRHLSAEANMEPEQENAILTLAQSRPSRLLRLMNNPEFLSDQRELFRNIAQLIQKKSIPEYFRMADHLAKRENRSERKDFLDALVHFLRTLLREKVLQKELSLGRELRTEDIIRMIAATEKLRLQLQQNVNKRMALENMFLSW